MKPMTLACRGLLLVALVCSHQMLLVHAAVTLNSPSVAANALSTHDDTGAPDTHADGDTEMVSAGTTVPALNANSSHAHGAASRALVSYNYRRSLAGQKFAWAIFFAGKRAVAEVGRVVKWTAVNLTIML